MKKVTLFLVALLIAGSFYAYAGGELDKIVDTIGGSGGAAEKTGDSGSGGGAQPAAPATPPAPAAGGGYGTGWPANSVLAKYGASGMPSPTGASVYMYSETTDSSGDELAIIFTSITAATRTSINSWFTSHGWTAGNVVVVEGYSTLQTWNKDRITAQFNETASTAGAVLAFRPGGAATAGGGGSGTLPAARGRLTITGLSAYNGKYVNITVGLSDGKTALVGIESISGNSSGGTMRLPQISGGRAVVPLYTTAANNELAAYAGNDTADAQSIFIVIMNTGTITSTTSQDVSTVMMGFDYVDMGMNSAQVRFSGGNATVSYESMMGALRR